MSYRAKIRIVEVGVFAAISLFSSGAVFLVCWLSK